tara:strand:- start:1049 stop:1759 length:711 start_codon:yes stop_codon:yes gene_type:complete
MSKFEELVKVDCSKFIEDKGGLSYISWASAWELLKKHCPDASYEHHEWQTLTTGEVMCYCTVTADGVSHKAHLPVLKGFQPIKNPNLFQINTAMQRCFAKAIGMHGLGLYVYRGEDLPTEDEITPYDQAVELLDDPIAFHEFVHGLDEEMQGQAFSGAPQGEKTKFKTQWRTVVADANSKFDEYVDFIHEGIEEQDANKVFDLVSDFSPYETNVVWDRLSDSQRRNLKTLMESIDE